MEQAVEFQSAGLKLQGVIHLPKDLKAGEQRPAFIVLHGFGSTKNAANVVGPCTTLCDMGYVTMRFDMRGCGDSEGEFGRVICLEQVDDTRRALDLLAAHPSVDGARVAVLGSSFGAAVAVYTGGVDPRVAAVVSSGGWGHGERKFRGQHPTPEMWAKFTAMLEQGREHLARTGKSLMVPRDEIVPVPGNLRRHLIEKSVDMFPAETAQSMFDFKAEEVIANIAPRPVLLLHSSADQVTPTEQSIAMFKLAGQPCDLHLFAETDHFMFASTNLRVWTVIRDWLEKYFPVR